MKRKITLLSSRRFGLAMLALLAAFAANCQTLASGSQAENSKLIPFDQLGAAAGKQYQGDGLSVTATPDGARLHCAFQRLEGRVTREGLWLDSTADDAGGEPFRVLAVEVGRTEEFGVRRQSAAATPLFESDWWTDAVANFKSGVALRFPPQSTTLSPEGLVSVDGQTVRFIRKGLTEEYSVSLDGVRQDFIIKQRPAGEGELRVELDVTGATAEPLVNGARLTLNASGRQLAYSRLRVTDATGRELPARMEVVQYPSSDLGKAGSPLPAVGVHGVRRPTLAVLVDDAAAVYPVQIDPTFSNADWVSMGGIPGADGEVLAAAADSSGAIYIGGNFTTVGEVAARCVAKWDGSSWSKLGDGLNGINVRAMAVSGADIYVGGNLLVGTNFGLTSVAKWDGSAWTNLGKVFGSQAMVYALAVSGTNLYVGGDFTSVGGIAATNIARWDGNAWSAMGDGFNHWVWALATSDTNLYVAGSFTKSGTNSLIRIARWDGLQWLPLGTGISGDAVSSLAVSSSYLYAAGSIVSAGGTPVNFIAKWDGNSWSAMGNGLSDNPTALIFYDGSLYAAGAFFPSISTVVRWSGSTWSNLPTAGANFVPSELLVVNGRLYAAGGGGNGRLGGVDRLEGNAWVALSQGVTSNILAFAVMGNDVYAGGRFKTAGGHFVNHVAKWDGSVWSPLGSGMNTTVYALTVSGTNLYAGGAFTNAGGKAANRVARWDGTAWSALGTGLDRDVLALATSGTNIYAGGNFTSAGGVSASRVARWNGSAWSPLGAGVNLTVNALTVSENILYAGGYFTSAGSQPVGRIAKWDGNAWSAVGGGFDIFVSALAVSGTDLYAGGAFTFATNGLAAVQVNRIAKWDGNTWSLLGTGLNSSVNALAVSGTDLFVGGSFYFGVQGRNYIAKWDGSTWSALGSGLDSIAFALAAMHTNLYVGGQFTRAGNKASYYAAQANLGPARGRFSNLNYSPVSGFSCTFLDATVGQPYRIQSAPALDGSWTDLTNFTYTAPIIVNNPPSATVTNRFFRAITP